MEAPKHSLIGRRMPWRLALGLTLVSGLAHLLVAWLTELSPDETYYALWSRALAWNYPDHPPAVAALIALGEAIFGPGQAAVRAPAIGVALLVPWLLAFAVARTRGTAVARRLLWLLHATILLHALGVITTPDTPLSLAWAAAIACLLLLLGSPGATEIVGGPPRRAWLLIALGLGLGVAILSKLTGWALFAGLLAALLYDGDLRRRLGGGRAVALVLGIAMGVAAPWALTALLGPQRSDLAFQLSRLTPRGRALQHGFAYLGGQAGVLTPGVLGLAVLWAGRALRARTDRAGDPRDPADTLLLFLALPLPVFFLGLSMLRPIEANWVGPAWLPALVGAAGLDVSHRTFRRVVGSGLLLSLLALGLAGISPRIAALQTGALARLSGWRALASEVDAACAGETIEARAYGLGAELVFRLGPDRVRVLSAPRAAFFERRTTVGQRPAPTCVVFDCVRGRERVAADPGLIPVERRPGASQPRVCIARRAPGSPSRLPSSIHDPMR